MLDLEFGPRNRTGKLWRAMAAAAFAGLLLAGCGDSGAERQKVADEIAKGIEDYLVLIEVPAQPIRIRHDKVTVTPVEDGESYDVAITGLRYGSAAAAAATFGDVTYRLTEQGDDQYQVSDLKMPAQVSIVGPDGKPEGAVKFETTAFGATWSKPLQNFLAFDWQMKDIVVDAGAGEVFRIATASATSEGKENGKGFLDQVSRITLNGLAGTDPMDGTTVKLDKLVGNVTVDKLDFPAYRGMMAKLNDLTAKYAPASVDAGAPENPPAPELTEEDRKALVELVRGFPKLMSGYAYDFAAERLTVADAQGNTTVQLAQGALALGLRGIDTDKARMNFSVAHDGLVVNDPAFRDPMFEAVLPKSGNLSLLATDLPVPSLVEGVAQALPELTSPDPQVAQGGQFMMMGAMMAALSKSTIKLTIEPSAIETAKAKLSADGELRLALETPQKAVGVVNFALLGLDDLIALASGMAQQSPDAMQAMGVLSMLQSFAQRETGADGKPVDKFKLDLTETGAVLVNGRPLDGIAP